MFVPSDLSARQARLDDLRREAIGQLRIRQSLGDQAGEPQKRSRRLLSHFEWLNRPWR